MAEQQFPKVEVRAPAPGAWDTATNGATERYIRVNITKNTKGYQYDTTVSVRSTDPYCDLEAEVGALNTAADDEARAEIRRREAEDQP